VTEQASSHHHWTSAWSTMQSNSSIDILVLCASCDRQNFVRSP